MRKLLGFLYCIIVLMLVSNLAFSQEQQGDGGKQQAYTIEYCNLTDEKADGTGGINGTLAGQELVTEAPDPAPAAAPYPNDGYRQNATEVDAMANIADAFFDGVRDNTATLVVSFLGDPLTVAVYYEFTNGTRGVRWTQNDLCNPNVAGMLDDTDGLELWGPGNGGLDANEFSEISDFSLGWSVYYQAGQPGPPVGYVPHSAIFAAVTSLGFIGIEDDVDVDALMVRDRNFNKTWDSGDEILFSIRAAANWDGGEIVHLTGGGAASFLNHGGHLWDTAFNIMAAFGVSTEEVDSLEADPYAPEVYHPRLPILSTPGIIFFACLLILMAMWQMRKKTKKIAVE